MDSQRSNKHPLYVILFHNFILSKLIIIVTVGIRARNSMLGLGPWALSKDINRSEEKRVVVKRSQLKSQRWGISERLSEEELLLGYDEYSSQYVLHPLV